MVFDKFEWPLKSAVRCSVCGIRELAVAAYMPAVLHEPLVCPPQPCLQADTRPPAERTQPGAVEELLRSAVRTLRVGKKWKRIHGA